MTAAFDPIATSYDATFTHTLVGTAQRNLVWKHLQKIMGTQQLHVLELNCGTGEDALWFAQQGAKILATDISVEMVRVAEAKAIANNLHENIVCKQMDIDNIEQIIGLEKFDIIFSNFGGLNCIEPEKLDNLLQYQLPSLLNKNGQMVFVVMPTFCLWESFYHTLILKGKNIFRRFSDKPLEASIGNGETIQTWYYSPKWIKKHLPGNIELESVKPIGFFVPPSYLNSFFSKRKSFFNFLQSMEKMVSNVSMLASASDHYLVHLQKAEG